MICGYWPSHRSGHTFPTVTKGGQPRLLDRELLDRFEGVLRAHRIGIVEAWAPGLSDDEIDELIAPTDLLLPDEVRAWWRWHNGVVTPDVPARSREILPDRDLRSLQDVLWTYDQRAGEGQRLLIVTGRPEIQVACSERGSVPAPVYWDRYDDFVRPEQAASSLGELVTVWMGYVERGVYASGPDGGWAADQPLLNGPPADVLHRGLW
jgi:hypothetical protein